MITKRNDYFVRHAKFNDYVNTGSLLLWFCKPGGRSGHSEGWKEVREVAW